MAEENSQKSNGKSANQNAQQQPEFGIQRLYIKDTSYEAPNTPQTFRAEWQPAVSLDVSTKNQLLEKDLYEVTLSLTATAKLGEQTAFLAEVHQAGIFSIRDFPEDQLRHLLGSYCLSILFPYAREAVTDLVVRGGFPALYLAPINFDVLFQQHLQGQQAQDATGQGTGSA